MLQIQGNQGMYVAWRSSEFCTLPPCSAGMAPHGGGWGNPCPWWIFFVGARLRAIKRLFAKGLNGLYTFARKRAPTIVSKWPAIAWLLLLR